MREKYFDPATKISHHVGVARRVMDVSGVMLTSLQFQLPDMPMSVSVGPLQTLVEETQISVEPLDDANSRQLLRTPVANRRKRSRVQDTPMSTPRRSGRKRARTSKTKEYLDVGKHS